MACGTGMEYFSAERTVDMIDLVDKWVDEWRCGLHLSQSNMHAVSIPASSRHSRALSVSSASGSSGRVAIDPAAAPVVPAGSTAAVAATGTLCWTMEAAASGDVMKWTSPANAR